MNVTTAEAKNRLSELIRAAEDGEKVIVTRHGKPVVQITPVAPQGRRVQLGGMKGRIKFLPGWDSPVDLDRFLEGDL
jgi:prevent-host-death family protein